MRVFAGLALLALAAPLAARGYAHLAARGRIADDAGALPAGRVAVVFGAGVRGGLPTAILYDRVAAAVELYKAGKAGTLLMSGDGSNGVAGEPEVMRRTALQLGVPAADIQVDLDGISTYDTCLRARDVFGLDQVVLVTQAFHLDRAVMICRGLGLDAIGYRADLRTYRGLWVNQAREFPAALKAVWDVYVTHPRGPFGGAVRIQ